MSQQAIYILGGHQSDFARNVAREDKSLFDLFADTVKQGMSKCRLDANEIQVGHVGNFVGDLFNGMWATSWGICLMAKLSWVVFLDMWIQDWLTCPPPVTRRPAPRVPWH